MAARRVISLPVAAGVLSVVYSIALSMGHPFAWGYGPTVVRAAAGPARLTSLSRIILDGGKRQGFSLMPGGRPCYLFAMASAVALDTVPMESGGHMAFDAKMARAARALLGWRQ